MKTKIKASLESRARRKEANRNRRRARIAESQPLSSLLNFGFPMIARGGLY